MYKWKQLKEKWDTISKYCEAQINHRFNLIVREANTPTDQIHYMRGECAGIDLFQRMPAIEIERLEAEIKLRLQSEEDNEDLHDTHLDPSP